MYDDHLRQIARDFADSGWLETAKRISDEHASAERLYASLHDTQTVADAYREQIEGLQRTHLDQQHQIYERLGSIVNQQAHLAANNAAAHIVAENQRAMADAVRLVNTEPLNRLIQRATRLALSPHTEDLLRRANDVIAAQSPDISSYAEAPQFDLPSMPRLEWMFELDRESLVFLVRLLFHLTAVLAPTLGVAVSISDGEVDTQDLSTIVGALNVLLAYALLALKEKDGDR